MKKALITDIQRFSLNDGPGIRTTVFFKGCNMHCSWCHNPETISHKKEIMLYPEKCIGCGSCFEVCPAGAHKLRDGMHTIDRKLCSLCGKCVDNCYTDAIKFSAYEAEIDDIIREILQDKVYYEQSGGGVTLSGGEVTCQKEAALEIAKRCKAEGISVAIETNLLAPLDSLRCLLAELDLVMLDLKIMDNEEHKRHTGVSNASVLKNISALDGLGIPFIIRTPLIPSITDSGDNIRAISEFIAPLKNLVYYELLNFNPLGEAKYSSLDVSNPLENVKLLEKGRLEELASIASACGVKVKIG